MVAKFNSTSLCAEMSQCASTLKVSSLAFSVVQVFSYANFFCCSFSRQRYSQAVLWSLSASTTGSVVSRELSLLLWNKCTLICMGSLSFKFLWSGAWFIVNALHLILQSTYSTVFGFSDHWRETFWYCASEQRCWLIMVSHALDHHPVKLANYFIKDCSRNVSSLLKIF